MRRPYLLLDAGPGHGGNDHLEDQCKEGENEEQASYPEHERPNNSFRLEDQGEEDADEIKSSAMSREITQTVASRSKNNPSFLLLDRWLLPEQGKTVTERWGGRNGKLCSCCPRPAACARTHCPRTVSVESGRPMVVFYHVFSTWVDLTTASSVEVWQFGLFGEDI